MSRPGLHAGAAAPPREVALAVLAAGGRWVTELGPSRWHMSVDGLEGPELRASFDDPWLVLEMDVEGAGAASPWSLLQHNGALGAGARLVVAPLRRKPVARCEILVRPEVDFSRRLDGALAELPLAVAADAAAQANAPGGTTTTKHHAATCDTDADLEPWMVAIADAGWRIETRNGRPPALRPAGPAVTAPFRVQPSLRGDLRVVSEVEFDTELRGPTRTALAAFLLTGSGLLRRVRAVTGVESGREYAALAVELPPDAAPAELTFALAALESAAVRFGSAATLLADPVVAHHYLRIRGTPDPGDEPAGSSTHPTKARRAKARAKRVKTPITGVPK